MSGGTADSLVRFARTVSPSRHTSRTNHRRKVFHCDDPSVRMVPFPGGQCHGVTSYSRLSVLVVSGRPVSDDGATCWTTFYVPDTDTRSMRVGSHLLSEIGDGPEGSLPLFIYEFEKVFNVKVFSFEFVTCERTPNSVH